MCGDMAQWPGFEDFAQQVDIRYNLPFDITATSVCSLLALPSARPDCLATIAGKVGHNMKLVAQSLFRSLHIGHLRGSLLITM